MQGKQHVEGLPGSSTWSPLDWLGPLLVYLFVVLAVSLASFRTTRAQLLASLDGRLLAGARSFRFLVAEDFHDRARGPGGILPEEDSQNIQALTEYVDQVGVRYLFSLAREGGELYITSSSATSEEVRTGQEVRYFTAYAEAAPEIQALTGPAPPLFVSYEDRWGAFRAAVVVERSPGGREYLAACEYSLDEVEEASFQALYQTLLEALLLLLASLPLLWAHRRREVRHQQERERLRAEMDRMQRLESLGRLAGGVAHDINNMLGVILGTLDLIEVPPGSPACEDLEEIERAAQRSAEITGQLLTFARQRPVEPRTLDLNQTIEPMSRMLQRFLGEDISFTFRPGEALWPVRIDPSQLTQLLTNLLVNARHAIEDVGEVVLETSNQTTPEDPGEGELPHPPGDHVCLVVRDDGCGMDPETLAHVFEPFYTTRGTGEGTGLGLATVHGIVQQAGGSLEVESQPGIGTTFRILLPRTETLDPPGAPEDPGEEAPPDPQLRLLLVEDSEAVRNVTDRLLGELGYTVETATSPQQALSWVEEGGRHFDLLVTDVVMPGMNGRNLYEALVRTLPELRCLYLSGYPADILARRGIPEESLRFLAKPFRRHHLAEAVSEALGAG